MRHLIIIIIMLFSLKLFSQVDVANSYYYISEIQVNNPDLFVLIDTILYMDSLCNKTEIKCYSIKIKDTIIADLRRYQITFIGKLFCCYDDTTAIYGCLKYRNHNFLFIKNQVNGIGIHVSENRYIIDIDCSDNALRHNIPITYCLYSLGRLWIMDREWDWSKSCAKYNYPIEVLIVKRN